MYLGYLDYLDYLDLLDYLDKYYIGIHALNNSNYITLAIGHTKHSGEQRVSSFPFAVKRLRASNSQDYIFKGSRTHTGRTPASDCAGSTMLDTSHPAGCSSSTGHHP